MTRGVVCLIVLAALPAHAQVRKQLRDGATVQPLTATERAQLGDPLFTLVLKPRPNEARLDEIERLLMGPSGKRHLFVVSEDLLDAGAGSRRAVIAYTGRNGTVQLDPNVMLSVSFTDQAFATEDIEVLAWDDARSRYNFYRLDRAGGGSLSWKFRGSSVNADAMTTAERAGTCMRCHITGAPVMKELPIPWNNWHSSRSLIGHLSPTATGPWPIANTPRFADLKGAQDLETSFVIPSIKQFNGRRADALVGPLTGGLRTVTNGPRLLKSLFATTEYNITSADQSSGLHPFPKVGAGPEAPVVVPDTFFLNANVLAGGSFTRYEGLGVTDARQFSTVLRLTPAEYRDVVRAFTTNVEGRDFDTHFAWFVPEASHTDNQMIDILVRRGIVTAEFAAAAIAVDLERPVFSEARESLLAFIPKTYRFKPRGADDVPASHPDALTRTVIQNIRATSPVAGTPAARFAELLDDPQPLVRVKAAVADYLQRERTALQGSQRTAEITRLYGLVIERRRQAAARIPDLVESPRLFPLGALKP